MSDKSFRKKDATFLGESEILHALIDVSSGGIYILREGKIIFASAQFGQLTGYTEKDIEGKKALELVHEEDRGSVRENAIACLKGKRTIPYEYRFLCKDGSNIWLLEKVTSAEINGKRVAVGNVMDITGYKELEKASADYKAINTVIVEESPYPILLISQDTSIKYANRALLNLTGFGEAELLGEKAPYPFWFEADSRVLVNGLGRAFKTGRWREEINIRKKSGARLWVELTAAVISEGETLFLTYVDITERKMAELAIREERDKAQKYLDVAEVILLALDINGDVTMINNKGCQILGYPENEIVGKNWFDNFMSDKYRENVKLEFGKLINNQSQPAEYFENPVVVVKDGTERIIAWHNTVLRNNRGRIIGTLSSGEDITDRIQAENMLKESELKYRVLTDSSLTGIYIHQDGKYVYVNDQFARMHGYSPDELMGMDYLMLLHPEDRDTAWSHITDVIKGNKRVYSDETRRIRKDGSAFWCQIIVTTIEYKGKPALMGNVMDISERKNMEAELKLKARMLDEATDSIIVHDEEMHIIYANEVATKLYGYSNDELLKMRVDELIVPEQQWIFTSQLPDLFAKGSLVIQADIKNKEGFILSTEIHSRIIESHDKKIVISISHDITARQKAEEELLTLATHDLLTGLPNRGLLNDRMNMALASSERSGSELAVMMLDLDRFKYVNDEFGHDIGDSLLQQTANRLIAILRRSDTIARLGGDEFFILLPEIKSSDDAGKIARKIIHAFRDPFIVGDHEIGITASLGVAVYPVHGDNSDTLTRNADKAMYIAKEHGRNTYEVYTGQAG